MILRCLSNTAWYRPNLVQDSIILLYTTLQKVLRYMFKSSAYPLLPAQFSVPFITGVDLVVKLQPDTRLKHESRCS